ncbi:MAG: hypothetical protein JSV85_03870, partial [Candidatus Bathyarchaeota archaeon]
SARGICTQRMVSIAPYSHKNIKYTLKYTQLVNFQDGDYIFKVARKPEEIKELIEAGFEYVTDQNGLKFFRKRK